MARRMMAGGGFALALALCLGNAVTAEAQAFRVARTFSLSGSSDSAFPVQAVLADVGSATGPADGLLDVVAVQQNQLASLLYGRGDGTFSAGRNTDVNDIPTALVGGDFDGDTLQDFVVAGTSKTVQWFRATGDRNAPFAAPAAALILNGTPVAIAAGFLNADQNLDLAVLNDDGSGGSVQVLLGNGDGSFAQFGEPFAAGIGVSAIVIAELTGDTPPDVAVTSAVDNSVAILRNNGTGFLETPATTISVGLEPVALTAGDVNHDGRADLVSANRSSDSVSLILAQAGGGLGTAIDFASGGIGSYASGVAVGDFNKDNNADILVANNRSSDIGILQGDGIGGFAEARAFIADQEPVAVLAADLNGDGAADGVSLNFGDTSPNVAVILRRADGAVAAIENVPAQPNPTGLAVGDVDGNGRCDFVVAHNAAELGGSGLLEVFRAPAGESAAAVLANLPVAQPIAVARGDMNGDGILDVVALNEEPPSLVLFTGKRQGGFDAAKSFATGDGITALVVGDWNADGRDDVAVTRVVPAVSSSVDATGAIEIRLATASGFSEPTDIAVTATAVSIDSGDFNDDGRLDLVVASGSGAGSAILLGNGAGAFASSGAPLITINNAQAVVVADFDRDEHDDVAALSAGSDRKVVVSFGDGTGVFPVRKDAGAFDGPAGLAARDVTADGIPDIIVADQASSNSVWVARSLGSMRRFNVTAYGVSRQPAVVAAGDFDGDGRYDMAAVTTFVPSVGVVSNDAMAATVRGDGNNDLIISAADTTALARDLADNSVRRIEDVGLGAYPASAGLDSNGDGSADRLDLLALAHRLFN